MVSGVLEGVICAKDLQFVARNLMAIVWLGPSVSACWRRRHCHHDRRPLTTGADPDPPRPLLLLPAAAVRLAAAAAHHAHTLGG